jgi:DNA-binding GntR family transcriptional regulator
MNQKRTQVAKTALVKSINLSDQIYDIFTRRILLGQYKSGTRIDINEQAKEFGVSRSPVKDALNMLYEAGIVAVSPNRGHYIRTFSRKEISEVFDFRILIERHAVSIGMEKLLEKDYNYLRNLIEKNAALSQNEQCTTSDLYEINNNFHGFHQKLVSLTANDTILRTYERLYIITNAFPLSHSRLFTEIRRDQEEHMEILDAIRQKKHDVAVRLIEAHLDRAKLTYMNESADPAVRKQDTP